MRFVLLLLLAGLAWGAELIRVTPEECAAHDLPRIDLSVDASGTALRAMEFPDPNVYLRLSGPPGGPLQMEVLARPGTLEEALVERFRGAPPDPKPVRARLAGQERVGVTFQVGKSLATTRWTALELPGLAVLFGASPGADPLAHPHLAPLAASLKVNP